MCTTYIFLYALSQHYMYSTIQCSHRQNQSYCYSDYYLLLLLPLFGTCFLLRCKPIIYTRRRQPGLWPKHESEPENKKILISTCLLYVC